MGILPKIKLPKIKRENLVLVGLLIIALAIPLTVVLLGVRQELRKGAAGVNGSILINNGAATTNSRNVTLTLTAPTSQASLLKPNIKIPQAHAAGCTISASPNPCTVQTGKTACTSTISWTTDDDLYLYVYSTPHPNGQLFSYYGAGSYTQDATWINCTDTFTFVGVGKNDGIEKCRLNVTGLCPAGPTPTLTPTTCGPANCSGCCYNNGCKAGTSSSYCGTGGNQCTACPSGYQCTAGSCAPTAPTPTPTSACYDSDGLDQYTKGYVDYTGPESVYVGRHWDECVSAGWQIEEYWCNDRGLPGKMVFNCDYGCVDGACRRSGTTPTPRPPTPTPTPRPPTPTPTPTPPLTVVGMMISNYSNFSGASEEYFATTKSWTLTEGDGLKTVYAKFKWSNGTWTSPVSDTITLQTTGPTPTPTPTTPPGVTPTPTPTTPPGVTPTPTPTPTPPSGQTGTAVCDSLTIGPCFIGSQLPYTASLAATVWGHDTAGAPVGFRFEIYYDGKLQGGASAVFTQKDWPSPVQGDYTCVPGEKGTWYQGGHEYCSLQVFQEGGGVTKACHLGDLGVGNYTANVYVTSLEVNQFGDAAVKGNYSSPCTASFSVYYEYQAAAGHYMKRCSTSTSGTPPEFEKPVISNLTAGSSGSQIAISFTTDIESEGVSYMISSGLTTTDPMANTSGRHRLGIGTSFSTTYDCKPGSTYYYKVCAWKSEYKQGTGAPPIEARTCNPPLQYPYSGGGHAITCSGGGGAGAPPLSASDADLNGNGGVDIGDWGALVDDYGQEGEDLPADFNSNGEVDILDASQFIDAYKTYAK